MPNEANNRSEEVWLSRYRATRQLQALENIVDQVEMELRSLQLSDEPRLGKQAVGSWLTDIENDMTALR